MVKLKERGTRVRILRFNEKWKRRSSRTFVPLRGSDSLILHNSKGIDRAKAVTARLLLLLILSLSYPSNFRSSRGYQRHDDSQIWNLTRPCEKTLDTFVGCRRVEMEKKIRRKGSRYVALDPHCNKRDEVNAKTKEIRKKWIKNERIMGRRSRVNWILMQRYTMRFSRYITQSNIQWHTMIIHRKKSDWRRYSVKSSCSREESSTIECHPHCTLSSDSKSLVPWLRPSIPA